MIYSMTGFASAAAEFHAGSASLELRTVNHRYLDIQLRLPDELRIMEGSVREAISGNLSRGKVECRINLCVSPTGSDAAQLNKTLLSQLALWSNEIRAILPASGHLTMGEILHWDGMLQRPSVPADTLHSEVIQLLHQALKSLSDTRAREGDRLASFLLQRIARMEELCTSVAPLIPAAIAAYEEKLAARLRAAMQDEDVERLHQEIGLFAGKIDVDEELSRLQTHLQEMRRVLSLGGAVGKRLDFLMQELHREANTLGSKSVDADVSRISMEMKLLIEQMREQIQNIE